MQNGCKSYLTNLLCTLHEHTRTESSERGRKRQSELLLCFGSITVHETRHASTLLCHSSTVRFICRLSTSEPPLEQERLGPNWGMPQKVSTRNTVDVLGKQSIYSLLHTVRRIPGHPITKRSLDSFPRLEGLSYRVVVHKKSCVCLRSEPQLSWQGEQTTA